MNKSRRKQIDNLYSLVEQHIQGLAEIATDLESLKDEEREAFDNLSEGLQQSEQGQATEAAADALDNAYDALDELDLQPILDALDEARA